jgi:hypothetical protein
VSTDDDARLLAARFAAVERIPSAAAMRVAGEILCAGPDIRASAMAWARSGQFPSTPTIHGESPASIARVFPEPSRVFWTLVILRTEPTAALLSLKHAGSSAPDGDRSTSG